MTNLGCVPEQISASLTIKSFAEVSLSHTEWSLKKTKPNNKDILKTKINMHNLIQVYLCA